MWYTRWLGGWGLPGGVWLLLLLPATAADSLCLLLPLPSLSPASACPCSLLLPVLLPPATAADSLCLLLPVLLPLLPATARLAAELEALRKAKEAEEARLAAELAALAKARQELEDELK